MSVPTVIFWGSYDALRTLSAADVDAACEPSDGGIPDPTNGVVSANLCVLLNGTVNATLLAGLQCAPLGPCYQLNHASRALFTVFCFFAPFAGCCCCGASPRSSSSTCRSGADAERGRTRSTSASTRWWPTTGCRR